MAEAAASVRLDAFAPAARVVLRALDGLRGPRSETWLVGGAVRDALLGRAPQDLDVAVPSSAVELGRALADRLGAAFVVLDEGRGVCRAIGDAQIDLADFRAPDLAGDMRRRDFTVNALAAPVSELVGRGEAIVRDPTGGLDDLRARRVALCAPRSLADDPVRVLRAARLAAEPGWQLHPDVEPAARDAARGLAQASAERVRDEVIALAEGSDTARGLRILDRLGALAVVLPESLPMRRTEQSAPHRFDVWEHSLRAVEAMDEIESRIDAYEPWGPELREDLAHGLGDRLRRSGALKLAALLHDVAKPETRTVVDGRLRFIGHDSLGAERARAIASRWRLSARATEMLARLVREHLRPMHLSQVDEITRRARYRFFRALGDETRSLLLLALADAAAVRGDAPVAVWAGAGGHVLRTLMTGAADAEHFTATPPLVRGEDVMATLNLTPGPAVGRLLAEVREAQALGQISTREEALALLRRAADRSRDSPADRSAE